MYIDGRKTCFALSSSTRLFDKSCLLQVHPCSQSIGEAARQYLAFRGLLDPPKKKKTIYEFSDKIPVNGARMVHP